MNFCFILNDKICVGFLPTGLGGWGYGFGWGRPAFGFGYGGYGMGWGGGYHGGMHTTNITNEYNTTNNITNNDNDVTNNIENHEVADGSQLPGAVENNDGGFSSEPQALQQEYPPEQTYDNQQVRTN